MPFTNIHLLVSPPASWPRSTRGTPASPNYLAPITITTTTAPQSSYLFAISSALSQTSTAETLTQDAQDTAPLPPNSMNVHPGPVGSNAPCTEASTSRCHSPPGLSKERPGTGLLGSCRSTLLECVSLGCWSWNGKGGSWNGKGVKGSRDTLPRMRAIARPAMNWRMSGLNVC
ncbi:hypothetical protein BDW75DRAFT_30270 [Aspergillus navahoensis]